MNITFYSLDSLDNKIFFKEKGMFDKNILIFNDKSVENTKIYLTINDNDIILDRVGNVKMHMHFIRNTETTGFYENELGLQFKMNILTSKLIIKANKVEIEYSLILDGNMLSSHKIWILFQ